jgi:Holliday junction resolvase RusA-like endonuclease
VSVSLSFFVPGIAVPKQRPRLGAAGHTYTPAATRGWEATVAVHARAACAKAQWRPGKADFYAVRLTFRWPDGRVRDIDNSAKAVLDAGNGILWLDDRQVDELSVSRLRHKESPGVSVTVTRIMEASE